MNHWPNMSAHEKLTPHQKSEVAKAMAGPVGILAGSPGVGKSFCIAEIAKSIIKKYGHGHLAIACPTAKAAVRVSELLCESGVEMNARTIHSMLRMGPGGAFFHNRENPLPYRFILLDESSMIDTDLAAALMDACRNGCHVLWTGDPNQLAPVGHGAPLRDLIAAGLPYGELSEIKRNSGGIVETCSAIRNQQPWSSSGNLMMTECRTPDSQIEHLLAELESARKDGFNPVWDCQILVAVNDKSPLSRKKLNKILQAELNQNPSVKNSPFRVADKIVNSKNGYFPVVDCDGDDEAITSDSGEVYVANGELAEVLEVQDKYFVARLSAPTRVIRIPRGQSDCGGTFELGLSLSAHKSQGSSWPVVIVLIDEYPGAKLVCDRAWLYTAISRAEKKCILIGKKTVADSMCRKQTIQKRKTFLRELICKERAVRGLAQI